MDDLVAIASHPIVSAERQYRAALRTLLPPGALPPWLSPGALRAGSLLLLPPTCHFLATGQGVGVLPALMIVAHDLLGALSNAEASMLRKKTDGARDDGVLDTDSAATARRKRNSAAALGHTVDAVFAVCVWLFLLALNPHSTLSIGVLWPLILTEACHGWQRLDTRRVAGTGASLGSYSITPDSLGRAKKLLCLCGTFLAVLPLGGLVRTLGRCILLMALPLAVEGARQAFKKRVIYVSCSDTLLTADGLRLLNAARAMGSVLVVGITSNGSLPYEQRREEALQVASVTAVIDEAPSLGELSEQWLDAAKVDHVVVVDEDSAKLPRVLRATSRVVALSS